MFRFRPCPWIILSALPSGLSLPIADPRLPKDYFCLVHAIPVCSCPTLPVLTMMLNKKLAFGSECLTSRHPRHRKIIHCNNNFHSEITSKFHNYKGAASNTLNSMWNFEVDRKKFNCKMIYIYIFKSVNKKIWSHFTINFFSVYFKISHWIQYNILIYIYIYILALSKLAG